MHTSAMSDTAAAPPQPTEKTKTKTTTKTTWTRTLQRYLPAEHTALVAAATKANVSINDYVRGVVADACTDDGFPPKKP